MAWIAKNHNAHPVPTPCYVQVTNQQTRLPRATSSLVLNASREASGAHAVVRFCIPQSIQAASIAALHENKPPILTRFYSITYFLLPAYYHRPGNAIPSEV